MEKGYLIWKGKYVFHKKIFFSMFLFSAAAAYLHCGFSPSLMKELLLNTLLILIGLSDHRTRKIPILYCVGIAFIGLWEITCTHETGNLLWGLLTFFVLFFIPGIGGGDLKLISASAILLGENVVWTFFLSAFLTIPYLFSKKRDKKARIPLGPYYTASIWILRNILCLC